MQTNPSLPDDGPLEHKHFDPVQSIEPIDQSCPICQTRIFGIVHRGTDNELRTYLGCLCPAETDFVVEAVKRFVEAHGETVHELEVVPSAQLLERFLARARHFDSDVDGPF